MVDTITTIVVGTNSIPREPYVNQDGECNKYLDDILNGLNY